MIESSLPTNVKKSADRFFGLSAIVEAIGVNGMQSIHPAVFALCDFFLRYVQRNQRQDREDEVLGVPRLEVFVAAMAGIRVISSSLIEILFTVR